VSVFRLPLTGTPHGPLDPLVSIANATSGDGTPLGDAIDHRTDTRWTSLAQTAGDSLTIELVREAVVSRVELDLGRPMLDGYPRRLRIARDDDPAPLWEGPTAGAAMLGALADPIAMPVAIDVPAGPPCRKLRLTLTASSRAPWTIAEIRVFGK
jgi:hypothetical protein